MTGHAEKIPPAELRLYHRNPNRGDIDVIAESLRTNNQYRPIVVNRGTHTGRTNEVLAGNHTTKAFLHLAEKYPTDQRWQRIDCWVIDVDDERAAKIVLADNRTAEFAERDERLLAELLADLDGLEGTGYTDDDLAELMAALDETAGPDPLTDADDIPPTPVTPITRPGDMWELGPHRVLCADSTDPDSYADLMAGDRAELVWTDPPYGVAYVGKTKDALTIENDQLDPDKLYRFLQQAFTSALTACRPGAMWYVAAPAGPLFLQFGQALSELGIWRQTISWVKDVFVMGRSHLHYRHEAIFYGWDPDAEPLHPPPAPPAEPEPEAGEAGHFEDRHQPIVYGWLPNAAAKHPPATRRHDTVWEVARPKRSAEHPTMKPVELIVRALELSSERGAIVLDPFAGSGSTVIACHSTGRTARVIELDPKYVDVIARRYQEHTGTMPVHAGTGERVDFTAGAGRHVTEGSA